MLKATFSFIDDFLDNGALKNFKPTKFKDIWSSLILILSGLLALLNSIEEIITSFVGYWGAIFPIIFSILGIIGSVHVIRSKETEQNKVGFIVKPTTTITYEFSQYVRTISKVLFVLFIIIFTKFTFEAIYKISPMSNTIYGYVYDEYSGKPISDVSVKIINSNGADITSNKNWLTDSEGFFVVETKKRIQRNCMIRILIKQCHEPFDKPLSSDYEIECKFKGNCFKYSINLCNTE